MKKENDDAKKYFDSENYNTIVVKAEEAGNAKDKGKKTNIIDLLTNENNRDLKEDALKILKQAKGGELLIEIIKESENHPKKHLLVAAFWEANIDGNAHLSFFTDLALHDSYEVCLEALTVIEEMQSPFSPETVNESLSKTAKWLENNKNAEKYILIENLRTFLSNFKTEDK